MGHPPLFQRDRRKWIPRCLSLLQCTKREMVLLAFFVFCVTGTLLLMSALELPGTMMGHYSLSKTYNSLMHRLAPGSTVVAPIGSAEYETWCHHSATRWKACRANFPLTDKRKQMKGLLEKVVRSLNSLGLKYWIDFGTMLACEREQESPGQFIAWDYDIDIAILLSVDTFEAYQRLPSVLRNIEHLSVATSRSGPKMFRMKIKGNEEPFIFVDTYAWKTNSTSRMVEKLCWDILPRKGFPENFDLREHWVLPLVSKSCFGGVYSMPNKPELILEARYGDWKTPQIPSWYRPDIPFGSKDMIALRHPRKVPNSESWRRNEPKLENDAFLLWMTEYLEHQRNSTDLK